MWASVGSRLHISSYTDRTSVVIDLGPWRTAASAFLSPESCRFVFAVRLLAFGPSTKPETRIERGGGSEKFPRH